MYPEQQIVLSYSRVDLWKQCKYRYKLRYIDKLEPIDKCDPYDPLKNGIAIHEIAESARELGAETAINQAIQRYFEKYPVIDEKHYDATDIIRRTGKALIDTLGLDCETSDITEEREYEISIQSMLPDDPDLYNVGFIGYVDLIRTHTTDPERIDSASRGSSHSYVYDFKFTRMRNLQRYLESPQLDLYAYYCCYENSFGNIRDGYYVICDKDTGEINVTQQEFSLERLAKWFDDARDLVRALRNPCTKYEKNVTALCKWCDYYDYCMKGDTSMILPKNERTEPNEQTRHKLYIYGEPFTGKSYLANSLPNPLWLSTDGNYTQLPGGIPPHIDLKATVTTDARGVSRRTSAWTLLKDAVYLLESQGVAKSGFETIVLDLVEDAYEACRLDVLARLGISHESEAPFGKGYSEIKTEFLGVIKRILMLDYKYIVLISHQDSANTIKLRDGREITQIKPAITPRIADKIAGMVDVIIRTTRDGEKYMMQLPDDPHIYGGGRLKIRKSGLLPANLDTIKQIYGEVK